MNSRDFCFWLQGFFEVAEPVGELSERQKVMIQTHLELVFKHDPQIGAEKCKHNPPSSVFGTTLPGTTGIMIC